MYKIVTQLFTLKTKASDISNLGNWYDYSRHTYGDPGFDNLRFSTTVKMSIIHPIIYIRTNQLKENQTALF